MEFKRSMIMTAHDLLHQFHASTVYTYSDEITLIFPPVCMDANKNIFLGKHLFNGKVNKLLSVIASYASVSFYKHISRELEIEYGIHRGHKTIYEQLISASSEYPIHDSTKYGDNAPTGYRAS